MEYTVRDRGNHEEFTLTGWGKASHFEAVRILFADDGWAVVLEPMARLKAASGSSWDEESEKRFRGDVQTLVEEFEERPVALVFDWARDHQTTVELDQT